LVMVSKGFSLATHEAVLIEYKGKESEVYRKESEA